MASDDQSLPDLDDLQSGPRPTWSPTPPLPLLSRSRL
jgi:hypothetical protein